MVSVFDLPIKQQCKITVFSLIKNIFTCFFCGKSYEQEELTPYASMGIRNVNLKDNPNDDAWYDLSGRKVNSQSSILNSQLPKGIYVHNGRKEIVR